MSLYFNSIKVRLELSVFSGSSAADGSFQFHKGAIRTGIIQILNKMIV